MTSLIQRLSLSITSAPTSQSGLKKSQENQSLGSLNAPQKSKKLSYFKEICRRGNLRDAFVSLNNVLTDQNPPDSIYDEVYSLVLDLCANRKALSQGRQIHAHVLKSEFVSDSVFLNTKLLHMYGKSGSLRDAEKLFDRMPYEDRTIFSWNAVIGACAANGDSSAALELYEEMRRTGVALDAYTFPSLLKSCSESEVENLLCGREIHGLAIKLGFSSNVFVANSLLAMYAKGGDIDSALLHFDTMDTLKDAVSWNSIISAYSTNGRSGEALRTFVEMWEAGVTPSTYSFVAALEACEEPSSEMFGMAIHSLLLKYGHYGDAYVATALLGMYLTSNYIDEAEKVFSDMEQKDNVTWNSLLSGYVKNGLYHHALSFFNEMIKQGQKPDHVSLISILSTIGRLGGVVNLKEVHAFAMKNGTDSDLQFANTLMDMYGKFGRLHYMELVFNTIFHKDHVSWTTVIAGYAQNTCHAKAVQLFQEALTEGIDVDALMIGSILQGVSQLKSSAIVKKIHGFAIRRDFYDLVMQNAFLSAYAGCGNISSACNVFQKIKMKNIVSFTSMISCCVDNGLLNEALNIMLCMKETGVEPDLVAILGMLSVVSDLSSLRKGKEIHGFSIRNGFTLEGSLASSLVDMYASCGDLEDSLKVFGCVGNRDLVLWTSMISAYGIHGCGKEAIELFKKMESTMLAPDHVTFLALLHACSHSAMVEVGKGIFDKMQHTYKLEPWSEHYACLVDMLGRANLIEEAFHVVKQMNVEPTAAIWCALLGACRIHSNKHYGDIAAQKLLELEPENPGNYVLVSNLYAAADRWEDVKEVRLTMRDKGLKKVPACSWINIGNEMHTFTAHDRSHPQSDEIYENLAQITQKLEREGGYVADTRSILQNVDEEEKVKMLRGHSERLAIAYGVLTSKSPIPIRITKNLRVCSDCHNFSKLASKFLERDIIVRDANRFHHFKDGICSCGDFW